MTPVNRRVFQELLLLLTALFAMFWAILRACVQSLTIDEADTYLGFASRSAGLIWYPASNNHVLNSLLMWITTCFLGTSGLTVRIPALAGAALYIGVCYFLCRIITSEFILRLTLFICLTYNPFLFDFMVAARGYSLAMGFLAAAIAMPLWHREQEAASLPRTCALASLCLGLSFAANFSFAFADAAAFLAIALWAMQRQGSDSAMRILEACVLPGLGAALVVSGYTVFHWPRGQLWYGATSLAQTFESITEASLFQLNPQFERAGLYRLMNFGKPLLLPGLGVLCICQLVVTRIEGSWLHDARSRRLGRLASALAAIMGAAILIHLVSFRLFGLLLPMDRTAIYLVPLGTLIAGTIAAVGARSWAGIWCHRALLAAFCILAGYFLLCLRLTYFKEWKWDAEVKDAYPVLARYNHEAGVTDVGSDWMYVASLNFYRATSGKETMGEILGPPQLVPGKQAYVLNGLFDRAFIDQEGLTIVYRGMSTDIVVAVKPAAAASMTGSCLSCAGQ